MKVFELKKLLQNVPSNADVKICLLNEKTSCGFVSDIQNTQQDVHGITMIGTCNEISEDTKPEEGTGSYEDASGEDSDAATINYFHNVPGGIQICNLGTLNIDFRKKGKE